MEKSVTSTTSSVRARLAVRSIAREMARAGRRARTRRRADLVGVPAEQVDRMIAALERIERGAPPPAAQ